MKRVSDILELFPARGEEKELQPERKLISTLNAINSLCTRFKQRASHVHDLLGFLAAAAGYGVNETVIHTPGLRMPCGMRTCVIMKNTNTLRMKSGIQQQYMKEGTNFQLEFSVANTKHIAPTNL